MLVNPDVDYGTVDSFLLSPSAYMAGVDLHDSWVLGTPCPGA